MRTPLRLYLCLNIYTIMKAKKFVKLELHSFYFVI